MSKKTIKLMADYESWPLWWSGNAAPGNIDPGMLPLSRKTIQRLEQWSKLFDAQLNWDDPNNSKPLKGRKLHNFESEGIALWQRLRDELGEAYEVVYFSLSKNQVLSTPDMQLSLAA